MFICVCHAVRDTAVDQAIEGGACTREQVTAACGAGGDCGACHSTIEDRIEAHEELVAACALVRRERAA